VPTLCLTSESDTVIKSAGVHAYAALLQRAQPGRRVDVLTLKGGHVALAHSDSVRYDEAIADLLVRCGFPERVTA
jgi:hypothetical protein